MYSERMLVDPISVATAWVFAQDHGLFDPMLGSWFFSDSLGFLGFFQTAWVFQILPKNTFISVFWA